MSCLRFTKTMRFPSTGCQPCRTRRLKCDETQPVCRRCTRSGRICHGARQAFSVVHIENSYASGQKKRPRGPRSSAQIDRADGLNTILLGSPFDLQTEAIVYYVRCHVQKPEDSPTLLEYTPDDLLSKWRSRAECPILDLAVSSLALSLFSQTKQHPKAALEASVKYQQLLQGLQIMLTSLDQVNVECCLLAITFMGLYEDSVHRPQTHAEFPDHTSMHYSPHQSGTLAVLKFWKESLSLRLPATSVIKHARRVAIKYALYRNLAFPEWMKEGASFGEHGLELEYDGIVARIACARQRLSTVVTAGFSLLQTSRQRASNVEILNEEAQDIDRALQEWATHFPSRWSFRQHTLPYPHHRPDSNFYSAIIHSHQKSAYAAVWVLYYTNRMLINSTRLSALQLSRANSDSFSHEQESECRSHIRAMADSLGSTIPFCLERFKVVDRPSLSDQDITLNVNEDIKPMLGSLIISPLTLVSRIPHIDIEHKLWFKSQLAHLGRIMGYGIFDYVMTDSWPEL